MFSVVLSLVLCWFVDGLLVVLLAFVCVFLEFVWFCFWLFLCNVFFLVVLLVVFGGLLFCANYNNFAFWDTTFKLITFQGHGNIQK